MSNSSTIVPSAKKRTAVEPVESEPVSKLVVSATGPNESVQRKENSNDVLVSTYLYFKWIEFQMI